MEPLLLPCILFKSEVNPSSFLSAGMKFSIDQLLKMTQQRNASPRPRETPAKRARVSPAMGLGSPRLLTQRRGRPNQPLSLPNSRPNPGPRIWCALADPACYFQRGLGPRSSRGGSEEKDGGKVITTNVDGRGGELSPNDRDASDDVLIKYDDSPGATELRSPMGINHSASEFDSNPGPHAG